MDIPEKYMQLYINWDVRIMILFSLIIQLILILLGRLRKTSTSKMIQMFIWIGYLFANWVPDFVLGRLSGIMDSSSSSNAITAFWAPFLIFHLGGPDTITAYSLEDNELWLRHFLILCYELMATFYVLFRSLPNTRLLTPTLLILFVGIIKYGERTCSFYKASAKSFRRSIDFAHKELDTCFSSTTSSSSTNSKIDDLKTLDDCFTLYNAFKPCFVDDEINYYDHTKAIEILRPMEPKMVLKVLDMELSFAYDELYTKTLVNHSIVGYVLRALCSICIWLTFFLYVFASKNSFYKVDVTITYVLLAASIILDTIAIVMLMCSDWMLLSLFNAKMLGHWTQPLAMHIFKIKIKWLRRRSRSREMPQLNLISNCLKYFETNEAPWRRMINWIEEKLGIVQTTDLFSNGFNYKGVSYITIYTLRALQPMKATQELMEIIVEHVKIYYRELNKKEIVDEILKNVKIDDYRGFATINLLFNTKESSFESVVFVYHIATELCFNLESENPQIMNSEKDACKYLSNYMMHMVVMRLEMMSTKRGIRARRFWRDYNDLFKFISKRVIDVELMIPKIEFVRREMSLIDLKRDTNNDTLDKAQTLARLLLSIKEEYRWQAVTRMWVILLINMGKHFKANMHLKQLRKGGDPLTLIWLLTKHFRFGEKDDKGDILLENEMVRSPNEQDSSE